MDPLKRVVDSLDGIGDAYKELYTPKGDKFVLSGIENHEDYEVVKTLRTENAGWRVKHRDATALLSNFKDLDPEAVKTALTENEALKAEVATLSTKDKKVFDDAVAARLKTVTAPLEHKITELTTKAQQLELENTKYGQSIKTRSIHDEMLSACIALNVEKTAYTGKWPDALRWAEANAEIGEDGKITTKDSGLDLKTALKTMQENGEQLHWFGTSSGGGARGGSDGSNQGVNPWGAGSRWNATAQGKIEAADPARARALAAAAGVDVHAAYHPKDGPPKFNQFS